MAEETGLTFEQALIKSALEMPVLGKVDYNKHGGYNFVPIDRFYEIAAKVLLRNGITWMAKETSFELRPDIGTKGTAIFGYSADVIYAEGVYQHYPNFFSCTIPHPLQGAQTAGSALSYFDKIFLRHLLKIQTGEPDADATDPAEMQPAQAMRDPVDSIFPEFKVKAPMPPTDQRSVQSTDGPQTGYDLVTGFIPLAKTLPELEAYWHDNQAMIEIVRADKKLYDKLVKAFTTRKTELKAGKE